MKYVIKNNVFEFFSSTISILNIFSDYKFIMKYSKKLLYEKGSLEIQNIDKCGKQKVLKINVFVLVMC